VPRKPKYATAPPNIAVTKLRALPATLREIAAASGAKVSTAGDWLHGRKKPGRRFRESIACSYPEIRPNDWDTSVDAAEHVQAELAEHEIDPAAISNIDAVHRLLREIRAAARDPNLTGTTREKLAGRELVALKFRQDLINNDLVLQDKFIQQNPQWLRVRDTVVSALAKHKEAAADVLAALEQLGI
jgi:hypothetical protein